MVLVEKASVPVPGQQRVLVSNDPLTVCLRLYRAHCLAAPPDALGLAFFVWHLVDAGFNGGCQTQSNNKAKGTEHAPPS